MSNVMDKKISEEYIGYSSKNERELLSILRNKLNEIIEYFNNIYPDANQYIHIPESTYESLLTEGFEKVNTIKLILDILIIKDERMASKDIYNECMNHKIMNDDYVQGIIVTRDCELNYDLDYNINLSSIIEKAPTLVDKFVSLMTIKRKSHIYTQTQLFKASILYNIKSFILMRANIEKIY